MLPSLVETGTPIRLLILHTRRPTYTPPWASRANVKRLALNPLSARETFPVAQARLGVDRLPEPLGALIADKAEGNALFAEEIVSFLVERGVVKHDAAGVTFDPAAVTGSAAKRPLDPGRAHRSSVPRRPGSASDCRRHRSPFRSASRARADRGKRARRSSFQLCRLRISSIAMSSRETICSSTFWSARRSITSC